MKPRLIALYLPQFHTFPENDEWWGKGFTEWTNVARARKLFPGHKQPHIPADLGFYNLLDPEVREKQAQLARESGIEGFCYYHYWFGDKQLMEKPFKAVLELGKPDFPFCLCWANHSWYKKLWDPKQPGKDKLLIEQKYPGVDDYTKHFYELLPAFQDKRYIRVNGKPLFYIYDVDGFKDVKRFIDTWRKLAKDNGLVDFYFIGTDYDCRWHDKFMSYGFDAETNTDPFNIHHHMSLFGKLMLKIGRDWLGIPSIFPYKKAIKYMLHPRSNERTVIPTICPNFDHTPRSGGKGKVLQGSTPQLFKQHVIEALQLIKDKPEEEQIVIVKSWNEWGEGNYLEPDLEFGHGYLDALKEAIDSCVNES